MLAHQRAVPDGESGELLARGASHGTCGALLNIYANTRAPPFSFRVVPCGCLPGIKEGRTRAFRVLGCQSAAEPRKPRSATAAGSAHASISRSFRRARTKAQRAFGCQRDYVHELRLVCVGKGCSFTTALDVGAAVSTSARTRGRHDKAWLGLVVGPNHNGTVHQRPPEMRHRQVRRSRSHRQVPRSRSHRERRNNSERRQPRRHRQESREPHRQPRPHPDCSRADNI
jgi:hypothetical protein